MKKIVVFGSINADLGITTDRIPLNGETIKGGDFYIGHGGKGANQAVAAAKLGGDVDLIGCVGNDTFGIEGLQSLAKRKVKTDLIKIIDGVQTGVAIIIKTEGDNRIILNKGANHYLEASHLEQYIKKHNVKDSIFITQLENGLIETIKAIKVAKANGMLTILNPAPAIVLDKSIYCDIDILVLNQSEAQIFSGIYPNNLEDCEKIFNVFTNYGLKNIIITLGGQGSITISNGNARIIPPYTVEVVDTTGAGDSYIGALAYSLSIGNDIFDSAILGSQVSALCVTKKGAQRSMPTLEDVQIKFNNGVKYHEK